MQSLEGGNSPIVEQNYGSTEGYHGQSGILEETEDTNPPGIILGGSGNVETRSSSDGAWRWSSWRIRRNDT
ncbi:fibronectin-binding protein [Streptococcus equi]|uniref:fibronectin-binding protein n=1 Tax=Streptococcus equi TaxID=1336 RepID=UPI0015687084|nr:fibronectin-binding protein [Streptococcus equi]MBT1204804.1 fibronectin-binding protein [Streptococcus equi subsp. equi]MCD3507600.1 fibronectin binding protein [Streptococcus equi subsp. equi]MCD3531572.1 fibronectin binding protein [Streptococcus equi subsp. equi]WGS36188.1 fibronectin-binding protein [Streptococcus equi]WOK45448.1 fibronectin-binding protein [Streptococcus equi subsp. equi]